MGKDYPDYGMLSGRYKEAPVTDLAELAVRLGVPFILSRTGRWCFVEDFRLGLGRWEQIADGGGDLPVLSTATWLTAGFSCYLGTGAVDGAESIIRRTLNAHPDSPLGCQVGFSYSSAAVWLDVQVIQYYYGTYRYYRLRVLPADAKVQLFGSDGLYHDAITGLTWASGLTNYHTLKLVWYPQGKKYCWLQIDDALADAIELAPYGSTSGINWGFQLTLTAHALDALGSIVSVDHVIFTYDEPQ